MDSREFRGSREASTTVRDSAPRDRSWSAAHAADRRGTWPDVSMCRSGDSASTSGRVDGRRRLAVGGTASPDAFHRWLRPVNRHLLAHRGPTAARYNDVVRPSSSFIELRPPSIWPASQLVD